MFKSNFITQSAQGSGQDRIQILRFDDRIILAVADGAGGRSGGAEAADITINLISQRADSLISQKHCGQLLNEIDIAISSDQIAGETTAVVVVVSPKTIFGASVGDSGAWILKGTGIDDLTRSQIRKPFLGSGVATSIGFSRDALHGTLLVATDGLLKYTGRETICATVEKTKFDDVTAALIGLVRYPSGDLPDDVTIGLCRPI
jgi:PPM family protein phosphatase